MKLHHLFCLLAAVSSCCLLFGCCEEAPEDFYTTLGVDRNASANDIKKSFRILALKYHPDKNKEEGASARFQHIVKAYDVLGDPAKRKAYDMKGIYSEESVSFDSSQFFKGFDTALKNLFQPQTDQENTDTDSASSGTNFDYGSLFNDMDTDEENVFASFIKKPVSEKKNNKDKTMKSIEEYLKENKIVENMKGFRMINDMKAKVLQKVSPETNGTANDTIKELHNKKQNEDFSNKNQKEDFNNKDTNENLSNKNEQNDFSNKDRKEDSGGEKEKSKLNNKKDSKMDDAIGKMMGGFMTAMSGAFNQMSQKQDNEQMADFSNNKQKEKLSNTEQKEDFSDKNEKELSNNNQKEELSNTEQEEDFSNKNEKGDFSNKNEKGDFSNKDQKEDSSCGKEKSKLNNKKDSKMDAAIEKMMGGFMTAMSGAFNQMSQKQDNEQMTDFSNNNQKEKLSNTEQKEDFSDKNQKENVGNKNDKEDLINNNHKEDLHNKDIKEDLSNKNEEKDFSNNDQKEDSGGKKKKSAFTKKVDSSVDSLLGNIMDKMMNVMIGGGNMGQQGQGVPHPTVHQSEGEKNKRQDVPHPTGHESEGEKNTNNNGFDPKEKQFSGSVRKNCKKRHKVGG